MIDASPDRVCRVLVIRNPVAGRGRRAALYAEVVRRLTEAGCAVTEMETGGRGDAERFAATADPARHDMIVTAGGDGTINEVVNGLVSRGDTAPDMPLGVVPLGTANILACEIGLSVAAGAVADTILAGRCRSVTVGRANDRHFLLMVGVGYDAHVVRAVTPGLKRRLGKLAYVAASLAQLRRYAYPVYRVTIDGSAVEAVSVLVCNGRHYAGAYIVAPSANLECPGFEVCTFLNGGAISVLAYGLMLLLGRLPRARGIASIHATRVVIEGPVGDPVQGDGDLLTELPVTVTVSERRIRLLCPDGPATRAR